MSTISTACPRRAKSIHNLRHKVTKDKPHDAISERVSAGTQEIQRQKLKERHFHASSQRGCHRTHASPVRVDTGFGQNKSVLFRMAADLAEESSVPEFVVTPYVIRGAITDLVAKIKTGKTTFALGEIVAQALKQGPVVYLTEQPPASFRGGPQSRAIAWTPNTLRIAVQRRCRVRMVGNRKNRSSKVPRNQCCPHGRGCAVTFRGSRR
jgi:hypothetical protein